MGDKFIVGDLCVLLNVEYMFKVGDEVVVIEGMFFFDGIDVEVFEVFLEVLFCMLYLDYIVLCDGD